ncbi:thiol: disulfide interchange protein DsbC [Aurantiacibacter atlanticus]|uniref:Thiol:disulfide interchange protein n=1 Tax=Aurantiacibacter atlanticus TaxID=1648404 RepID=A0A0H4VFG2_9SPHN|nr:DsbC family protein [Aurantiacibacter atlanticus]AKQ41571.1 thiol: disulfide interchange protein DsbC [Aurantiacibacter atlanticus]
MKYSENQPGLKARLAHVAIAASSAAAVLTVGVSAVTAMPASAQSLASEVAQALKLRLPKTPIDEIACDTFGPWCEVVSGETLFYIDKSARYLLVGRLYDMEERRDVTASRLLELNPDLIAAGAARAKPSAQEDAAAEPAADTVDLSTLPAEGAIHWGNKKGPKLVVFSDFQCGYCRRLVDELGKAGVRVEERPISILGSQSRRLAETVICSNYPASALHQAYEGALDPGGASCAEVRGLDANEAFARANGFGGTPVIVRASDGAVLHGYRDADTLREFAAPTKEQRK